MPRPFPVELRPHMLRNYCESQWLRAGIPINQVAKWLGDDPRTVPKVYAHVLGERQTIEAVRRLNEIALGPSQDPRGIPESSNSSREEQIADKSKSPLTRYFLFGAGGI